MILDDAVAGEREDKSSGRTRDACGALDDALSDGGNTVKGPVLSENWVGPFQGGVAVLDRHSRKPLGRS